MSKATLSVEIDRNLIERVNRYSEATGKAVSETLSELIEQLPASGAEGEDESPPRSHSVDGRGARAEEPWDAALTPAVRRLLAAGAGPADEEDYREDLMEKYGR